LLHLFLNLLALGINAATAERSQEDTSLLIVMFIIVALVIVVNIIVIIGFLKGK